MNKITLGLAVSLAALAFAAPAAFAQANNGNGDTFTKADGNNDGKITFEEAMGINPTLTRLLFDQADANKDGVLDETEFGALTPATGTVGSGGADVTTSTDPGNGNGGSSNGNGGSSSGNGG